SVGKCDKTAVVFLTTSLSGGGAEKQLLIIANEIALAGVPSTIVCLGEKLISGRYEILINSVLSTGVHVHWCGGVLGVLRAVGECFKAKYRHSNTIIWSWGYRAE